MGFGTYDFVLERNDGVSIYMHPGHSKPTVKGAVLASGISFEQDHVVPKNGKGGSDGKGSFQPFLRKNYTHEMRFDNTKGTTRQQ